MAFIITFMNIVVKRVIIFITALSQKWCFARDPNADANTLAGSALTRPPANANTTMSLWFFC